MNKKFSTLLTFGLLMAGSLVSVANAAGEVTLPIGDPVSEFKSGKKYFVVQDNDGALDIVNSFLLGFAKDASAATKVVDASTQLKGSTGSWTSTATTGSISELETNSYIWTVTETKEGTDPTAKYFYTFTNVSTGKKLMLQKDGTTLVDDYVISQMENGKSDFTWTNTATNNPYVGGNVLAFEGATVGNGFLLAEENTTFGTGGNFYHPS